MSILSPLGPATLVRVSLAAIALTASACSPLTPKEDAVQSSAQGSAEDTDQNTSQIDNYRITPLNGVSPDTLEEFCELFPETKTIPNDVLPEELIKKIEDAKTMDITPEEHFKSAIKAVHMNGEVMQRAVEEATGDAPAQSR